MCKASPMDHLMIDDSWFSHFQIIGHKILEKQIDSFRFSWKNLKILRMLVDFFCELTSGFGNFIPAAYFFALGCMNYPSKKRKGVCNREDSTRVWCAEFLCAVLSNKPALRGQKLLPFFLIPLLLEMAEPSLLSTVSSKVRKACFLPSDFATQIASGGKILQLDKRGIGNEGARAISEALEGNITITSLLLWRNQIGPEGARSLCGLFTRLTHLQISFNPIGDKGVKYITEALIDKTLPLTQLVLESTKMTALGAKYVSDMLRKNSTLDSLVVSANSIGDKGACYIFDALECSAIVTLYISNCDIGDVGATQAALAIKKISREWCLYLCTNDITNSGARDIADALCTSSTLSLLHLAENRIGEDGQQRLSEAAKNNTAIRYLYLENQAVQENNTSLP